MRRLSTVFGFVLGFVLGFALEISVEAKERIQWRAISESSPGLLQNPEFCLQGKTFPCALEVPRKSLWVYQKDGEKLWVAGADTTVILLSEDRVRLVSGALKVSAVKVTVETELTSVRGVGPLFVERYNRDLNIFNASLEACFVKGRGWLTEQILLPGFTTALSRPEISTGIVPALVPTVFNLDEQVAREARFYTDPVSQFPERVALLKALVDGAAPVAAGIHESNTKRKLASIEAEKLRKSELSRLRAAKDLEIRQWFRRRFFSAGE